MENLSAHKPLSKSHQSYHQYRSFTALKTLFPAHFLAHSSLTEAVHFLLAAKRLSALSRHSVIPLAGEDGNLGQSAGQANNQPKSTCRSGVFDRRLQSQGLGLYDLVTPSLY